MKDWRVHFLWAIVTALVAVLWARVAKEREAAVPPPPPPPASSARNAPAAVGAQDVPADSVAPAGRPVPAPPPDSQERIAERIRALIPKCDNGSEIRDASLGLSDRSLKLTLAKEALLSRNIQAVNWGMNLLGEMKSRDATRMLEEFLKAQPEHDAATNVISWLGTIHDLESLGPLTEALHSKREEVRDASALALLQLGYSKPAEQLAAAVALQFESADGSVRREAVERMVGLIDVGAIPVLCRALQDSNGDVRMAALGVFYSAGKPEYLPYLEPLQNDPNPRVARQARLLVEELQGEQK